MVTDQVVFRPQSRHEETPKKENVVAEALFVVLFCLVLMWSTREVGEEAEDAEEDEEERHVVAKVLCVVLSCLGLTWSTQEGAEEAEEEEEARQYVRLGDV